MGRLRHCAALLAAAVAAAALCCRGPVYTPESMRLHCILLGNTEPDSPFSGFNERLPDLIRTVNLENPVIVIHSGNLIHGGHSWMGIKEKDLTRQYEIFQTKIRALNAPFYCLPGEKDLFNRSARLFQEYTGKKALYSFNYGAIHIVMAPMIDIDGYPINDQIAWIDRDLSRNAIRSATLVITHMPPVNPQGPRLSDETAGQLHKVLVKYRVQAVVSGGPGRLYETSKDGIRYIVAGCGGFSPEDRFKGLFQYYTVHVNGAEVRIEGKKL
ncbi:MAG: metallophosphoesterase [Spirochaetes bacterium]|nr:metallophosphoesterase [Spirochaetota bacterium]